MTIPDRRIILKDSATRQAVEEMAVTLDWRLHEVRPQDQLLDYESVWVTQDGLTAIHYAEEPLTGFRYLWVRGQNVDETISSIRRELLTYRSGEVLDLAWEAETEAEKVMAIHRVGVFFKSFQSEAFDVFRHYLQDASPVVRRETVYAISFSSWLECDVLIDQVAREDPDPEVSRFAERYRALDADE